MIIAEQNSGQLVGPRRLALLLLVGVILLFLFLVFKPGFLNPFGSATPVNHNIIFCGAEYNKGDYFENNGHRFELTDNHSKVKSRTGSYAIRFKNSKVTSIQPMLHDII